jgi:peptidoglycan/LPS O-acetylase OafA/YrhL
MAAIGPQANRWGAPAIWVGYYFRAAFCWYMSFAFIGFFLRRFSKPARVFGYLADASYWSYIVHLPFLVLFQAGVARTSLPVLLKFAIVMAATVTHCLVSYHFLVRSTWLGGVLNGRRVARGS